MLTCMTGIHRKYAWIFGNKILILIRRIKLLMMHSSLLGPSGQNFGHLISKCGLLFNDISNFDGRHLYDLNLMRELGFTYYSIAGKVIHTPQIIKQTCCWLRIAETSFYVVQRLPMTKEIGLITGGGRFSAYLVNAYKRGFQVMPWIPDHRDIPNGTPF